MAICIEFRDDDNGYLAWLATHVDGYVISIASSHSVAEARVHHARCQTINGRNPRGGMWTGPYVKLCGNGLDDVQRWAIETVGQPISPCGTCRPGDADTQPDPHRQRETDRDAPARRSQHQSETATATESLNMSGKAVRDVTLTGGHCAIRVPSADFPAAQAWADDYIRFERRPAWQEQLRNGIRFEHGTTVPAGPNDAEYAFSYRYELASTSDSFAHWQCGRTLAAFDWIDLDSAPNPKLAHVWLALARSRAHGRSEAVEPASAVDAPFAVRIQVRPPQGRQPSWGDLMKPVFDGVISAFQAHTDSTVLPIVAERLGRVLDAEPAEIEQHLLEQRWATLGVAPRLVLPYREGVKWDPADHRCVAGELLAAAPNGPRWGMRGEVLEVTR